MFRLIHPLFNEKGNQMELWLFRAFLLTLTVILFGIHGLKKLFAGTGIGGAVKRTLVGKIIKIISRL